jgi:Na+/proline symporter
MLQFALFLLVGLLLWSYYDGATPAELGLSRGDEIFPRYIIEGLPAGVSGLLLAGIIAAAMSTLSSSLNSLASSSMLDLFQRFRKTPLDGGPALKVSRALTLFWGAVLVGFASLFESTENPVVELGLTIASFTYGGLLGVFLLGILNKRSQQIDALIAFAVTIVAMISIIFGVWYSVDTGWTFLFNPPESVIAERGLLPIAWPWFPVIGSSITVAVGSVSTLFRRR